jgi:hypothetical protein
VRRIVFGVNQGEEQGRGGMRSIQQHGTNTNIDGDPMYLCVAKHQREGRRGSGNKRWQKWIFNDGTELRGGLRSGEH